MIGSIFYYGIKNLERDKMISIPLFVSKRVHASRNAFPHFNHKQPGERYNARYIKEITTKV